MNSKLRLMLLMWLVLIGTAHADTLDQIKKDGVLVVGVRNGMRPFGFIDKAKMELVGYDVDFARAIAGKLGVKLQLKSSDAKSPDAPLIPLLLERKVDLIAGAMTKSAERMKQIDFSLTYYVTGQTFLVKKGTVKAVSDLAGKTIGTTRKSTAIDNLKNVLPGITIVRFSYYREAFTALKMGGISAVCTDATILEGLLAADPQKAAYEILDARISSESYGLGVRKGEQTRKCVAVLEAHAAAGADVEHPRRLPLQRGLVPVDRILWVVREAVGWCVCPAAGQLQLVRSAARSTDFREQGLETSGMGLFGLGQGLEPVRDLGEAFVARVLGHARVHIGVLVRFARHRRLEIGVGVADR